MFRWEVAVAVSDNGFQQMSFVNSIATTKGGRHVDYISKMIEGNIAEVLKKKNKGGVAVKPHQIRNHLWVFVNALIVNPSFDSQTKENMTLQTEQILAQSASSPPSSTTLWASLVSLSLCLAWSQVQGRPRNEGKSLWQEDPNKLKGNLETGGCQRRWYQALYGLYSHPN